MEPSLKGQLMAYISLYFWADPKAFETRLDTYSDIMASYLILQYVAETVHKWLVNLCLLTLNDT